MLGIVIGWVVWQFEAGMQRYHEKPPLQFHPGMEVFIRRGIIMSPWQPEPLRSSVINLWPRVMWLDWKGPSSGWRAELCLMVTVLKFAGVGAFDSCVCKSLFFLLQQSRFSKCLNFFFLPFSFKNILPCSSLFFSIGFNYLGILNKLWAKLNLWFLCVCIKSGNCKKKKKIEKEGGNLTTAFVATNSRDLEYMEKIANTTWFTDMLAL